MFLAIWYDLRNHGLGILLPVIEAANFAAQKLSRELWNLENLNSLVYAKWTFRITQNLVRKTAMPEVPPRSFSNAFIVCASCSLFFRILSSHCKNLLASPETTESSSSFQQFSTREEEKACFEILDDFTIEKTLSQLLIPQSVAHTRIFIRVST